MQLQVHCHPLLIQPGIQCHLDEIRLDIHQACYPIAVDIWSSLLTPGRVETSFTLLSLNRSLQFNVVGIKYRFVSWIELNHIVIACLKEHH